MGLIALRELGIERIKDHGAYAFSEMGVGHPQTCLMDGLMAATGCTYGKLMMERLNYGKIASILHVPGKGTVRVSLLSDFQDELGKEEFFAYRRRGVEPSEIPETVTDSAVRFVLDAPETKAFKVERLPNFAFRRPRSVFQKTRCTSCGEYVFDRYVRVIDGMPYCIPCSSFRETWVDVLAGIQ